MARHWLCAQMPTSHDTAPMLGRRGVGHAASRLAEPISLAHGYIPAWGFPNTLWGFIGYPGRVLTNPGWLYIRCRLCVISGRMAELDGDGVQPGLKDATLRRHSRKPPGRGAPLPIPAATLDAFRALGRRVFHGCDPGTGPLRPSFRFRGARHSLLLPEDRTPNDAAGFASCYGPHRRSPYRLSDTGLSYPARFVGRAGSLLPDLLATRPGLPLRRDDDLANTKKHHPSTSRCNDPLRSAHEGRRQHRRRPDAGVCASRGESPRLLALRRAAVDGRAAPRPRDGPCRSGRRLPRRHGTWVRQEIQ